MVRFNYRVLGFVFIFGLLFLAAFSVQRPQLSPRLQASSINPSASPSPIGGGAGVRQPIASLITCPIGINDPTGEAGVPLTGPHCQGCVTDADCGLAVCQPSSNMLVQPKCDHSTTPSICTSTEVNCYAPPVPPYCSGDRWLTRSRGCIPDFPSDRCGDYPESVVKDCHRACLDSMPDYSPVMGCSSINVRAYCSSQNEGFVGAYPFCGCEATNGCPWIPDTNNWFPHHWTA